MGARWSQTWVKARGEAAFTRVVHADFDSDVDPARPFGMAARAAQGEAVYLAIYDGPAGEVSGTFLYEHARDGAVVRALAYALAPDEALRWVRVEGQPEPWEADALAQADEEYAADVADMTEEDPEALAIRWARGFTVGEQGPRVSEYALSDAVFDQVLRVPDDERFPRSRRR